MRRAHSVHEMRQLLERRAENKTDVPPILDRLKQNGYLDDARYAAEYARTHARSRKQGRYRITRELRTRGVPDRHIETALEAAFAVGDEATMARARIKKKIAQLHGQLDEKKIASLYRSLLRAGFSGDTIRTELRAARIEAANVIEAAEAAESTEEI
jgi:regulatory protein